MAASDLTGVVPGIVGARSAALLGVALLVGLGALTTVRLLGMGGSSEEVLQQPITAADLPADRAPLTAPDPGDNP